MSLTPDINWDELVPHPRYGNRPVESGHDIPLGEVVEGYWRYSDLREGEMMIDGTAIPADVEKQNGGDFYPRQYYIDLLKVCKNCDRRFIFYALEQQYWYEELGFYKDTDCVMCPDCRQHVHYIKSRFSRYGDYIKKDDLSDSELATLVSDAVFLFDQGLIAKRDKLGRLKNMANKRIPDSPEAKEINALTDRLRNA